MGALRSAYPEILWPAVVEGRSAALLALLFQWESSQWWSAERLIQHQFLQLTKVVEHARRTVPYYSQLLEKLGDEPSRLVSPEGWQRMPLLSRRDIQLAGKALHSSAPPKTHGRVAHMTTSGSTGQPVETLATAIDEFFWQALTLRDHFWHRRDFSQRFAAIRHTGNDDALPPGGSRFDNWGPATAGTIETGPVFLLNVRSSLEEQVDWLQHVDPGYLLCYPSVMLGLARIFEQRGCALTSLRQLRTFGELLEPDCRATCERVFGVKVADMYSSQEVGYLALQCPDHDHYHLMSESVLVEILDDGGRHCQAGQTGRVVVTTLHNFAMPLLRYDIGDYAEVGPPCPCGRGLPTLARILGRKRNLLLMPDGTRRWPVLDAGKRPADFPPLYQFQIVQRSAAQIDLNVVRDADLSPQEGAILVSYVQQMLGYPFEIRINRLSAIPRSPTGKFEDFVSEVA